MPATAVVSFPFQYPCRARLSHPTSHITQERKSVAEAPRAVNASRRLFSGGERQVGGAAGTAPIGPLASVFVPLWSASVKGPASSFEIVASDSRGRASSRDGRVV